MKIKDGFVLREIADTIVVVPTGELAKEFNGMINLNKTGKFIWELLQINLPVEEIANKLAIEYNIDKNKSKNDVEMFINKMKEANIFEE